MGRRCVLLVSHDRDFLTVYDAVLRFVGYDVLRAADADDALRLALLGRADLVISDFPTFAASGQTVTEMLRDDPRTTGLRILCVTSRVLEPEVARAYDAGAVRVLPMPASPRELALAVDALLAE